MGPGALESTVTPDLLKEAGYTHLLDWPLDDQPVWMQTRTGPLLSPLSDGELNHPGAQAHRDHTGHQFAEMIVDHFEDLLEQSQPHGRARARTPADAAARTFLAHSIRVAPRGHRRPGGGQGRKRSTVGNALDTAVPNDPASFAPYLLARDPSRVVIHLASAVFGLRLATVRTIRG
jgi:hypothetical protein